MKDLFVMDLQLFAEEGQIEEPSAEPTLDDDNFFNLDDEPAGPQAGEEPAEETIPEADINTEPYKLKIKYNHEEMEIPENEAIPLIQKGMNYDKLQERYDNIQNDPRLSDYDKVSQVSKLLGYQTEGQLIDALYQNYYQLTAQQQGLTPQQIQKEHELNQEREQLQMERQTAQQQQQNNAMYSNFMRSFPDVQTKDIKPETWEKVTDGMDLTTAYVEQQNTELTEKYKILEQKMKNKDKAPVSGVTSHGATSTQGKDPFEMGFDSIQ